MEADLRRQLIVLVAVSLGLAPGLRGQTAPPGPGVVSLGRTYLFNVRSSGHPLVRWRRDTVGGARTLSMYYEPDPEVTTDQMAAVERAFETWNRVAELPLRFRHVTDPEGAEVRIRWVKEFDRQQAGLTEWETDGTGWILRGTITLARRHRDGLPMGPEYIGLVAVHEIGHLIGLPHSEDPGDVMHPGNRNLRLSSRDHRSVYVLYSPPTPDGGAGP